MLYQLQNQALQLEYCPETFQLTLKQTNTTWCWKEIPSIRLENGTTLSFANAKCVSEPRKTGVADGVHAVYSAFTDGTTVYPYEVDTFLGLDVTTGNLRVEMSLRQDQPGEVHGVCYPPAFHFDAAEGEGYTILPRMQGTILPAGHPLEVEEGIIFERDAYIPIYAQVKGADGYLAIIDTPYDARYQFRQGQMQPIFIPSLGLMDYRRIMLYAFRENCNLSSLAGVYRDYLKERGKLVTLKEKIARNPKVAELIGTPIVHTGIATHISPDSDHYHHDDPSKNDYFTPFSTRAAQLRELKAKGVEKVYLHLDGWGNHGYDNLHPDVFPPHEASGGADGMRQLQQTCTELGYMFGIHDQYRDYYYDAETFSFDSAVTNIDGSHPYCSIWYGGKHSFLCSALAPEYVRRNYNEFERLGIKIDGSYLDVFAVVTLDECFHPDHRVTREQCAQYRRECLDILTSRGIIPSSEELLGSVIDSQVLCHHAPFYPDVNFYVNGCGDEVGHFVPLMSLVYHDCVVTPWFADKRRGGFGIAKTDMSYLWALLCGDTVYCNINETGENLPHLNIALELHKQVALCQLCSHDFINGNPRHRRSVFSDGTTVEVDLDSTAFEIRYPDGRVVTNTEKLA